jgi:hypothetical protein
MHAQTGRAVLAATGHLSNGGPPLSSLVGRIAAGRGLTLAGAATTGPTTTLPPTVPARRPAAARLAGRPEVEPASAEVADRLVVGGDCQLLPPVADRAGAVALLAAHGGAGVSSLLRAGLAAAGAVDGQRCWPAAGRVLLVARTSTGGLELARELACQHASGQAGQDIELVGLVLVADAPGRLPARISALADLVCGGFTRCWQVPWLTEWRLATASEPLPVHPEVARLSADLHALTGTGSAQPTNPTRPDRSRGALR